MIDVDALFWSHLTVLNAARCDALLDVFGSFGEARTFLSEELLRKMGCREETVRATLLRAEEFDADRVLRNLQNDGIRFLTMHDDAYPAALRTIADRPVFLYAQGDPGILHQPCLAIVGTREMTQYGRRIVQSWTARFIEAGLVTVSGLALGVDGLVAEETLRSGGKTIAVLGHGLGRIYPPSHTALARRIVEGGGLLLSEYPPGQEPERHAFPGRNRIIAGLSLGTLVIEAPEKSGALITADFALDEGRDVFAVPGSVFSERSAGCNARIASGQASLVRTPDDVLIGLGIHAPTAPTSSFAPPDDDQAAVWSILTTLPQDLDQLVAKAALPAHKVNAALTMMELAGAARNVGTGEWVKA